MGSFSPNFLKGSVSPVGIVLAIFFQPATTVDDGQIIVDHLSTGNVGMSEDKTPGIVGIPATR
jgi:hypothetical protein